MLYNNEAFYTQDGNFNFSGVRPNYTFNQYQIKNIPRHEVLSNNMLENFASTNSTIDGDSPIEGSDVTLSPDHTRAPPDRRDPIYTAIPGLKWKSKSKKWVVRWDNPITNRRVYKYFSGQRYGFLGAHKRAAFYLEFLNASVGKGSVTSGENPFFRRNEGPPKGKTNKGLQRKHRQNAHYHKNLMGSKSSEFKYQNIGDQPFNMMESPVGDVNSGNIDFLSAEHLLSTPIDLQYVHQGSGGLDQTADKRTYADYCDMYNNWKQMSSTEQSVGSVGMMNYPTYIYNPQNFNEHLCQYGTDDRFYRPLPYGDQSNSPNQTNMQYQNVAGTENQNTEDASDAFMPGADKDVNYQTPVHTGKYMNYSNVEFCQTPFDRQQRNLYNVYDNIEYFNQDINDHNKNHDNLTQSVPVNWIGGYDDSNSSFAKMHNDGNADISSKRAVNDSNSGWISYKRANVDN